MTINITSRIRNAMIGLVLMLCMLFIGLIFLLVYVIEDRVFVNQIKIEQATFNKVIKQSDPQLINDWQPLNSNIQRVDLLKDLPNVLSDLALTKISKQLGVHEYFDEENALFIATMQAPNNNQYYYLVYDVKDLLVVRSTKRTLLLLVAVLTVFITIIAIVVAHKLTKSTLAPVTRLSNALQSNDLDHTIIELANEFSKDEIGVLAHELAQTLERMRESSQREYEFNRGVSHELRSPIQVAQSAMELLQVQMDQSNHSLTRPVDRLQRSIIEMNEIAEAFLWLASGRVVEDHEMCTIENLLNTLTIIQPSFPKHKIRVETSLDTSFYYRLPKTVLAVLLRNLLRNAVAHGALAAINVTFENHQISITNATSSSNYTNEGFGIGLSIAQNICECFECKLTVKQLAGDQFYSSVKF